MRLSHGTDLYSEMVYTLNLPSLEAMTEDVLHDLSLYLRITSLITLLIPIVEHQLSQPPTTIPSPTRIIPARPAQAQGGAVLRLRLALPPISILQHMAYSAIKIGAILWMLCRDMKWGDVRFWILAGAAAGWWVGDGLNAWFQERPRVVVRPDAGPPAAQGHNAGAGVDGAAQGIPGQQGNPGQQGDAGQQGGPRPARPPSFASATAFVPLIHLSTDSAQLGHPTTNPSQPLRDPVRRTPSRLQTQFVLPFILWFVTLIPEWENIRARVIRQRERAMRVVVGELTNISATAAQDNSEGAEEERQNVYPEGLNDVAQRYYERVMRRGEGVDWEEEREAQRAMGIPDEDAGGDGDEMRMPML